MTGYTSDGYSRATDDALQQRLQTHLRASHTLQAELRGGGMSRVFVAQDIALSRRVVVKVLNPTLAATVSVERFQREIMLVAKLNHPNIVPVLSAGEVDGLPYFIMPFIEGESLRGRILRGPLSIREAVGVMKDVTRALAYAHGLGVVHRDIKPDNILIAGSAAVVTDFGVAKAVSAARERGASVAASETGPITGIGISLGTPQYMAPEQAAADPNADSRVDLYALGTVGYELLVGAPPFHGRNPQALLAAQLTELPAPLPSRRYDVPAALSTLIMRCLEKDPAERPRSATEVLRALEDPDVISGTAAALPAAVKRRRWNRVKSAAFVGLPVIVIASLMAWAVWPDRKAPPATTPGTTAPIAHVPKVRVPPVTPIGNGSTELAAGISAAVETALLRDGVRVDNTPAADGNVRADSTMLVVQMTVQRSGSRARVNVRLYPMSTGTSAWADQLDFRVADSFAAQDTIAQRVRRAVRAALP